MKVLVTGPSGAGKTYISRALQAMGINAFDDGDIEGLSAWYKHGKKVPAPTTADEAMHNGYAFLWDKTLLANFINRFDDVYVFGGSGNVFDVFALFDKVYFLHVQPALQMERLRSPTRAHPLMDSNADDLVVWGAWFEAEARKRGIAFVDVAQTPAEIWEVIGADGGG